MGRWFQKNSRHTIEIISLPAKHWKWRMHGSAISFAEKLKTYNKPIDFFIVTDLMDNSTFKALLISRFAKTPDTNNQYFFGISAVKAVAAGCTPLFPNRFAFKEHLPQDVATNYLYKKEKDFEQLLID